MAKREVTFIVDLDSRKIKAGARKGENAVRKLDNEVKSVKRNTSLMTKGFSRFKIAAGVAFAAIAAGAGIAIRRGVELAQTVEETGSKFRTVLGDSVEEANEFLDEYATLLGLSTTQGREMLATNAAIAQGFGFLEEDAADFAQEIVRTAGDLTSFNNIPIEDTARAVSSAMAGERESLKRLGIVIREEDVTLRALKENNLETADAITQQMRATATLALIQERAGVAMGDLVRTQDSVANRSRQVTAEIQNIAEAMSVRLLGATQEALNVMAPWIGALKEFVTVPVSQKLREEQTELNMLVQRITLANTEQGERNRLITELNNKYPGFLENLDKETVSNEELRDRMKQVNELFVQRIALQVQEEEIQSALRQQNDALRVQMDAEAALLKETNAINEEFQLGIDSTNMTLDEYVNAVREAVKADEERQESGLAAGLAANEQAEAVDRLMRRISNYQVATRDVDETQEILNEEMRIADTIMQRYATNTERATRALENLRKAQEDQAGDGEGQGGAPRRNAPPTPFVTPTQGTDELFGVGDLGGLPEVSAEQREEMRRAQMDLNEEIEYEMQMMQEKINMWPELGEEGKKSMRGINNFAMDLSSTLLSAALNGQKLRDVLKNIAAQLASRALMTGLSMLLNPTKGMTFFGRFFGFRKGGMVESRAHGGVISGSIGAGMTTRGAKFAAINENGRPEFVVNAEATRRNRELLEAINQSPDLFNRASRSMDSEELIRGVTKAVQQGLSQARITAEARFSQFDDEYDEFQTIEREIGNTNGV